MKLKVSTKQITATGAVLAVAYTVLDLTGEAPAGTALQVSLAIYIVSQVVCEIIHPEKKK